MKRLLVAFILLPFIVISQDSWVELEFQFDGYAEEVSWGFYSSTDTISVDTGFYSEGQPNAN